MKKIVKLFSEIISVVLFFALFVTTSLFAQSDAKELSSEVNKDLRAAQNLIFSGKPEEAQEMIPQIEVKITELKSIDPENSSIKTLERKINKLKKDLEIRLKISAPQTRSAAKPALSKSDTSDRLPAGAARCIREIDKALKKAEHNLDNKGSGSVESKAEQARYEMKSADSYWDDLNKKYPETLTHASVTAAKKRIDDMYARIDSFEKGIEQSKQQADELESQIEKESKVWVYKLIPYTAPHGDDNYNPDKYFVSGYTEDAQDMKHRMKLYAEASTLFSEYRKAEFPNGKTEELEKIEKELGKGLDLFKEELLAGANRYIYDAQHEIELSVLRLAKNTRIASAEKPLILNDSVLRNIDRKISWAENLLPGDSRIDDLKNQFDALKNEQRKWREKMIEDTRMLPDKFKGAGDNEIKQKAQSIVNEKYLRAKILRENIINEDWNEEEVIEFTDTTQSAVRYRVTRSVIVQVASTHDGECFLYSVYIAKNRLSTGGWSGLYGHIMFTDKILEENVNK